MSCKKLEKNQCRTCNNASTGLNHLRNIVKFCGKAKKTSYAELISEVSNINIMDERYKELPQFICDGCSRKLKTAHAFIQQAHKVNEQLITMLAGKEKISGQLECLEEDPVDIESCLEIKMEHDEVGTNFSNYEAKTDFEVTMKIAKCKEFELRSVEKLDTVETASLERNKTESLHLLNNLKHKNEDMCSKASTEEFETNSKALMELLSLEESDNGGTDSENNTNPGEMISKKSTISEETVKMADNEDKSTISEETVKMADDEDVAVPCNQCHKIFNNSKALTRHECTSHIPDDKKSTCPLCFRKFSRSCNMYTHMRTFHGPDIVPLVRKPSTQERIFQCDTCPRNYTKKKHLNVHVKNKHIHDNESTEKNINKSTEDINVTSTSGKLSKPSKPKRYEVRPVCSVCGSSFSTKTHLIVHMRRHTGERPFQCDLCDRAYPRKSELTCHRRIHTGEKPFACKICDKTFRVSSKMTTHMRSHTDIRPYKCTQCDRSFKYSKGLSIHFRIHTGERPYSCNVCGSTFTQNSKLKAHRVKLGHMENANH